MELQCKYELSIQKMGEIRVTCDVLEINLMFLAAAFL